MIALIAFDHTVKLGGIFHPPGKPIKVANPEDYLNRGAKLVSVISETEAAAEQSGEISTRGRRKKSTDK